MVEPWFKQRKLPHVNNTKLDRVNHKRWWPTSPWVLARQPPHLLSVSRGHFALHGPLRYIVFSQVVWLSMEQLSWGPLLPLLHLYFTIMFCTTTLCVPWPLFCWHSELGLLSLITLACVFLAPTVVHAPEGFRFLLYKLVPLESPRFMVAHWTCSPLQHLLMGMWAIWL